MILREYLKKQHFKLSYQDLLMLFSHISNQTLLMKSNKNPSFSLDNITVNKNVFSFDEKRIRTTTDKWKHSLALLVIHCLTGKKKNGELEKSLETIFETKLYWALKRAIKHSKILLI